MKHPLTRLFAPIAAIIIVAASSAVISTADTIGLEFAVESTSKPTRDSSEELEAVVAVQVPRDRAWTD